MEYCNDSEKLMKDIQNHHFIDYYSYCEIMLMEHKEFCYKCGKPREFLTYIDPSFYYLPCWDCSSENELDRKAITEGIIKNINSFYNRFIGDRYLQLFITDDIYPKTTFPHNFTEFKETLGYLEIPNKNNFWFIDWKPGYPKIICRENLDGLKIVDISDKYVVKDDDSKNVKVNQYTIEKPLIIPYDQKHFYKNSIFNITEDRRCKKIKLNQNDCYKLFNTGDNQVKSVFNIKASSEDVYINNLTYQDYTILKLAILRNKTYLKTITDIINAIISDQRVSILRDSIFLKNEVVLRPNDGLILNLIWNSNENKILDNNCINISII